MKQRKRLGNRRKKLNGDQKDVAELQEGDEYYRKGDYQKAATLYLKYPDKLNSEQHYDVGWLYEKGDGVAQDYKEAMRWYSKAAEMGNAEAMISIGILYSNGGGVKQDATEAMMWYRKSC